MPASFRVVEDGQARAEVVSWTADRSPVAEFGASQLKAYVQRMSGALLEVSRRPVVQSTALPSVLALVSRDALARLPAAVARLEADLRGAPEDAFALRCDHEVLVLAGTNQRGTLYATYALLERLGVRFFAPQFPFYGSQAEYVPAMRSISLPPIEVVERPAMSLRRKNVEEGWSHTPRTLTALIDWMAKRRLNALVYPFDYQARGLVRWDMWRDQLLPELQKRGLLLEVGGHGYQSFLPARRYAADHPDWFEADGAGAWLDNFDATNSDAVDTYAANVVAYLRKHPEVAIFSAWPADAPAWPRRALARFGTPSDTQAHVVNRLATHVESAGLPVRISALAYSYTKTLDPPRPANAYDASVIIDLAPFDRRHTQSIDADAKYVRVLERWRECCVTQSVAVHEYYRRYAWRSLPVLIPHVLGADLRFYRKMGVGGLGTYSEPADWLTFELNHLLVAALTWDASLDVDEFVAEYVLRRYHETADHVGAYIQLMEAAARTIFDRPHGDFSNPTRVSAVRALYARARDALQGASHANPHIQRLIWNLEYAHADIDISYYTCVRPDEDAVAAARQRMRDLLERHQFDGIMLRHPAAIRRFQPDAEPASLRSAYAAYRHAW